MDLMLEGLCMAAQAYHMANMSESKRLSRPRDPNQLAKLIADIATGEQDDRILTEDGRDLAAVMLGRLGGLKGGAARAASLSAERRKEIAERAAQARWSNNGKTTSKTKD
jgi:hypothetical protein